MLLKKAATKVNLSLVRTPDCLILKTTRQKIHETSVDIVKEKSLSLTFVKMLRKTLFRTFAKDFKTILIREEGGFHIQMSEAAGHLWPRSKVRASMDGKLLRGYIKGGGILAKLS